MGWCRPLSSHSIKSDSAVVDFALNSNERAVFEIWFLIATNAAVITCYTLLYYNAFASQILLFICNLPMHFLASRSHNCIWRERERNYAVTFMTPYDISKRIRSNHTMCSWTQQICIKCGVLFLLLWVLSVAVAHWMASKENTNRRRHRRCEKTIIGVFFFILSHLLLFIVPLISHISRFLMH